VIAISRPHFEKQRKDKLRKILDAARQVFCRKGFLAVKMQDIIDECGISRGGIYVYFSSVEEVFLAVLEQRNKVVTKWSEPFEVVLDNFMARQKERLMNFENSLFRAYCEYIFSQPKEVIRVLRDTQLTQLRGSVEAILNYGVSQDVIKGIDIPQIAVHFIVTIDGLSVLALGAALPEEIIDEQFAILTKLLFKGGLNG